MAASGKRVLDRAFDELEQEVPDRVTRVLRWLRSPRGRKVRLPLGVLCIVASFFWFLPVIGLELLPIGLLLVAIDVPFLQKPVGVAMLWLEARWRSAREAWRRRHPRRPQPRHRRSEA